MLKIYRFDIIKIIFGAFSLLLLMFLSGSDHFICGKETTVLDIAVLGLLDVEPMHGYQIRKVLTEMSGTVRGFSYGSLYPVLNRLEENGFIAVSYTHLTLPTTPYV